MTSTTACSPAWSSLHKSVVFTENLPGFTCALSVWAAGTGFPHSMAGCWPLPGKKAGSFRGYSYEIGLNEFAISDSEEYVTQVTILVS
ncbi:MAG: hypothetical protein ACLSA0_33210 [Eisenbergiella massiliensis]